MKDQKHMEDQSQDRRSHPRTPLKLKVVYRRLNTFFHDYTRNISKGGTFIKTTRPLQVGTKFVLELVVPELSEALTIKGQVRWVVIVEDSISVEDASTPEPGMGVQFLFDTESEKQRIHKTVEELMKKHLGEHLFNKLMGEQS